MKKRIAMLMSCMLAGSTFLSLNPVWAGAEDLARQCWEELRIVEARDLKLQEKAEELWTQVDLNQNAADRFQLWDDEINVLWGHLKELLDSDTMKAVTQDEIDWIYWKEDKIEEAGAEVEGGSMQPMLMDATGAELTKDRVYYLMQYVPAENETSVNSIGENGWETISDFAAVQSKEEHKEMYGKVLSQYKKIQKQNFYKDDLDAEPWDLPKYVNPGMMILSRMIDDYQLFYTFADLDGDGKDELFIAGGASKELAQYIDVYRYEDGKPVHFWDCYDLGERVYLSIYKNGVMEVRWSESAADSGYDFYLPGMDGVQVDHLSMHGDQDGIKYYQSMQKENEITAEQFYEIYRSYTDVDLIQLNWKALVQN